VLIKEENLSGAVISSRGEVYHDFHRKKGKGEQSLSVIEAGSGRRSSVAGGESVGDRCN